MAPHAGIIIAASVLVAAGIAAYENPQIREWVEKSSSKVALAFRSLADDIHGRPPPRPKRNDPSMREDDDEKAEERRRLARQEIMERGRAAQEKELLRRRSTTQTETSRTSSFDSLVDENGKLKSDVLATAEQPHTSALETQQSQSTLRARQPQDREIHMHESVDSPILLRQLSHHASANPVAAIEPWESQYEHEMRTAWNIPLPAQHTQPQNPFRDPTHTPTLAGTEDARSSHLSESLIDLTPTTDDFPDPDFSIPSTDDLRRSDYFSISNSTASLPSQSQSQPRPQTQTQPQQPPQFYYAHPTSPLTPISSNATNPHASRPRTPQSSAASVAGSMAHVHHSDLDTESSDDEPGDGIRTPGSVWTEIGSEVSGDH